VKQLPIQIPYICKKALYTEFVKSISSIKRIKQIVTQEERALTLIKTRVLCLIAQKYEIKMTSGDLNMLALNLKSLIHFDSPRFLISEVSSAPIQIAEKLILKNELPQEKTKESQAFKSNYFSRAIEIFKDDHLFMDEI
jgi:hypothetical protein